MKKLIYLLLLTSAIGWSQIDIKDTMKYQVYVADTLYSSHNNLANALENFLKLKKTGTPGVEILPYGKVTATLSGDFFEGSNDTIFKTDTLYLGDQLLKTVKDTTLTGVLANRMHEKAANRFYKGFFYTSDSLNNMTKLLKVRTFKDTLPLTECGSCKYLPQPSVINIRTHYEGKYPVKYEEYESDFKIEYHLEISRDSTSLITATYANDLWSFWHREGATKTELYKKQFEYLSDSPGDGLGDPGTEDYSGTVLRRHSHESISKFCQIMARRNDTGYAILLDPDEN